MNALKSPRTIWSLVAIISSIWIIIYGARNNPAFLGIGIVLLVINIFGSGYFKK